MAAITRALCITLCLTFFVPASSGEESAVTQADGDKPPCWADDDYWMNEGMRYPITSKAGMLKTFLLPINLDTPEADAIIRHAHADFRFLAVGGFTVMVPEVDRFAEDELICKYGTRFIDGTSDAIERGEHERLMAEFVEYSRKYNLEMRRLLGHAK